MNQYNNPYQQTVYVTIKDKNGNSQTIVSNKIHPFFTRFTNEGNSTLPPSSEGHNYQGDIKDAQWVDASNLKAGYELLSEDGKWQVVQHVEVKNEPLSAYNLTVDNDHTYFIAGNYKVEGVWVHNNCWNNLPSDATNTGKTLPDGRALYTFKDDKGKQVLAYKGSDGRYYNKDVYPPSKPIPTKVEAEDYIPPLGEYNKKVNGPGLSESEKLSYKQKILPKVAANKGWIKDERLTKMNSRIVYRDPKNPNILISQDTQHGTFERHNLQGGHLGEMDITGQPTKPASSHKLKVK